MARQKGSLPVPDFDLVPAEALPSRIKELDIEQVDQLIGYERNHGERSPVLTLLTRRRDQIRTDEDSSVEIDVHDAGDGCDA
ncbi:hypothetical protein FB561_6886 [Kribbella amoyensis]|uniref:DUF8129 domain-containing protein n=1 Tax=Kribbella amoyensis TaxID=996641 RepID=A0A561B2D0_9ACTN|nr:hypothetical protein [Kribbella amoyensis]TWD73002.1 hypothetical protein FB561_6886 [Kribbella amoyensis]